MRLHRRWIALSRWSGQFDPRPLLERGPLETQQDLSGLPPGLVRDLREATDFVEDSVDDDIPAEVRRIDQEDYPRALLDLSEPPALLWGRGNWSLLDDPTVAVVGSRACTGYGRSVASGLGAAAARDGIVVVSGAARGIDRAAQTGALDAGGGSVGVLGAGLGARVASTARALLDRLAGQGLLLSELPPDHPPTRFTFPRRNRIIAALARATVVVEAARRSGALHTANAANRLGRPLFAVPGPIDAPASAGCLRLLAQGAHVVTRLEDVLVAVRPADGGTAALLGQLDQPRSLGELALSLGAPPREILGALVALELTGGIRRLPDHRYVRV
ncbi:MAG TPA: DNA-processing protein DprA [Myxococcota bacterium]|nr:DNA-processing protein DprA [Myxococcota bacterium]